MSALEMARNLYARLRAQRNGHSSAAPRWSPPYERNELDEVMPSCAAPARSVQAAPYERNELNEVIRPAAVSVSYRLVTDAAGLSMVTDALNDAQTVAIDLETTGEVEGDSLDPRKGRIRL